MQQDPQDEDVLEEPSTEQLDADIPEADALEQREPSVGANREALGDATSDADEQDLLDQQSAVEWDIDDRRDGA